LVDDERWRRFQAKEEGIAALQEHLRTKRVGGDALEKLLRRPETDWAALCEADPSLRGWSASAEVLEQVMLEGKYAGYLARQAAQVERFARLESKPIPGTFDYAAIPQLRAEAREKLTRVKPLSIGQAGRISGITPADLAVVLLHLENGPGRTPEGD
jgi:tRNA uridine 5-carboxymethylaminomethyl modification enzyme